MAGGGGRLGYAGLLREDFLSSRDVLSICRMGAILFALLCLPVVAMASTSAQKAQQSRAPNSVTRPALHSPVTSLKVALLGDKVTVASLLHSWQGAAPKWVDAEVADVLITLDTAAFHQAARWHKPRLGLNLPTRLVSHGRRNACNCSKVFLYSDPSLQLELVRKLFRGRQRVAVVYQAGDTWLPSWMSHWRPDGISLYFYAIKNTDELRRRLDSILTRNDVLLLAPSPELFNAATARFLLLSSYRHNRPVVGPGSAFVEAGSIASVYADKQAVITAIKQQLTHWRNTGSWLNPLFPSPSVSVNQHVAHAFDANVVSLPKLRKWLGGDDADRS